MELDNKTITLITAAAIGMFLLGYGFYGFFGVKMRQAETGEMACPFGVGKGMFSTRTGVFVEETEYLSCSYAFECLLAGAIALGVLLKFLLPPPKFGGQQNV